MKSVILWSIKLNQYTVCYKQSTQFALKSIWNGQLVNDSSFPHDPYNSYLTKQNVHVCTKFNLMNT
jgi:hypothetical protein